MTQDNKDQLDVLDSALLDMFVEAEPQTDTAFTQRVIESLGQETSSFQLWSIILAGLMSLALIASQFSGLESFVGMLAQPMMTQMEFLNADLIIAVLFASLTLAVIRCLPKVYF